MAKMPLGLLGPLIGKIGNIVVCKGKRGTYVRARPRKRKDKPTPRQKIQRAKLALVSTFLTPLRELVNSTFYDAKSTRTGWGNACSYNMINAVFIVGKTLKIVYSRTMVCQGKLPGVQSASAAVTAPGAINFSWTDYDLYAKTRANDKAILVVYCESVNKCAYTTNGAGRSTGTDTIQVPGFSGRVVQTWLAFASADGKGFIPSVYTGELAL